MSTLYKLTAEYAQLLEMAEDPDTSPETLADTLEALSGEIEAKADGYGMVIRELSADSDKLKSEITRLKERKDAIDNNIKRMKENLQAAMIATDRRKFKTTLFSFNIQKNPASVVMDEPYIENIPEEYLKFKEPEIDRAALKRDLQAGKDLEGLCHLEQTESLRIR